MRNVIIALSILGLSIPVVGGTVTYSLIYDGPLAIDADTTVMMQVRATFDAALVASEFSISATGNPQAVVVSRSADQVESNGLSYIPKTWPLYYGYYNDLPQNLTSQGPLHDVLMDLDATQDGIPAGTNVLVESFQFIPNGTGSLTISIGQIQGATTNSMLSSSVDPSHSSVTLTILQPLECGSHPQPDANHPDTDGDTVPDVCDLCANYDDRVDSDGDGIPDGCDRCPDFDDHIDADRDGVPDQCDNCPIVANADQSNVDGDSLGDACDPHNGPLFDYDADGDIDQDDFGQFQRCYTGPYYTVSDLFPDHSCDGKDLNGDNHITQYDPSFPNVYGDLDLIKMCRTRDKVPADIACGDCNQNNVSDAAIDLSTSLGSDVPTFDFDADGVQFRGRPPCARMSVNDPMPTGCDDNCPCTYNPDQVDSDGNGIGDACENPMTQQQLAMMHADSDNDGIADATDNCVNVVNPQQTDADDDTIGDACDNCPSVSNVTQADTDADGVGDVCDNCASVANLDQADADGDGIGDTCDNCPSNYNPQQYDIDEDGIGDACDPDIDNDGIANASDNCPTIANADQTDTDSDGVGNACDNCPSAANADQLDTDMDQIGDACDTDIDNDDIANENDNCPNTYNPSQADDDQNGVGNACEEGGQPEQRNMAQAGGEGELAPPPDHMSVYLVTHDGQSSNVTLPSTGGSVVVDLVVENNAAIPDFFGVIAASAPNIVTLDSTNWTDADNIRAYNNLPALEMASSYNLSLFDWWVVMDNDQDGTYDEECRAVACLDDPRQMMTEVFAYPLTGFTAPFNEHSGQWYMGGWVGGLFRSPLSPSRTILGTFTLNFAAVPGTFNLAIIKGMRTDMLTVPVDIPPGAPLVVTVLP